MYWVQTQCTGHCFRNRISKRNQTEWWSYSYRAYTLVEGDRVQLSLKHGWWPAKKPKVMTERTERVQRLSFPFTCRSVTGPWVNKTSSWEQLENKHPSSSTYCHSSFIWRSLVKRKWAPGFFWLLALAVSFPRRVLLSRFHAQSFIQRSHFV